MEFKSKEELALENTMRKIGLLRDFLRNQLRMYSCSTSDWVEGNHNAYEITLDLLNALFKKENEKNEVD